MSRKTPDISGVKFGRLIALSKEETKDKHHAYWRCQCDCGNTATVRTSHLKTGFVSSCGCYKSEASAQRKFKHGDSYSPTYRAWASMKNRCTNPSHEDFALYKGRGITVCERWMEYKNFLEDMGSRPSNTSIDRINNNDGYYPENCRWATATQQARNKRNNLFISLNGKTKTIAEWSEITGINYGTLITRVRLGWTSDRALLTPPRPSKTDHSA